MPQLSTCTFVFAVFQERSRTAAELPESAPSSGSATYRSSMPQKPSTPSLTKEVQALLRPFRLEDVPSHLLRRAHFKAEEIFATTFSQQGVTPRQKAALVLLHQEPGLNQNALSERLSMDRNTVADMVRRMSASGLIKRRPSPGDGRTYQLYVTAGGCDLLNRVMPGDAAAEAQLLTKLPPEYQGLFVKCLRLIAEVGDDSDASRNAR